MSATEIPNRITVKFWTVHHDVVERRKRIIGVPLSPRFTSRAKARAARKAILAVHPDARICQKEVYFNRLREGDEQEARALLTTII